MQTGQHVLHLQKQHRRNHSSKRDTLVLLVILSVRTEVQKGICDGWEEGECLPDQEFHTGNYRKNARRSLKSE